MKQNIKICEGNLTNYNIKSPTDIFYFLYFEDFNDYPIPKGEQNLSTCLVLNKTKIEQYFNSTTLYVFDSSNQCGKLSTSNEKVTLTFTEKLEAEIDINIDGYNDWLQNGMYQRLSDATIPSVVVMTIIYFIPMILCILLTGCGIQPMKARAGIPIFASFVFFFRNFTILFHFFPIQYYNYKCYANYIINKPLRYSSIFNHINISKICYCCEFK